MIVLAIVSDLHFGTVLDGMANALLNDIEEQHPDAVIVAGDLTQRARSHEFEAAVAFLERLPGDLLVLPGNHDIPTYRLIERAFRPFGRYRRYVGPTGIQCLQQPGWLIVGINTTARMQVRLRWQEGRLRRSRIDHVCRLLREAPKDVRKIVVTHHPLIGIPSVPRAIPAHRAADAVRRFREAGAEMLISGHTHLPFRMEMPVGDADAHQPLVAIGTPSALSNRLRGEPNGYWRLRLPESPEAPIDAELRTYAEGRFIPQAKVS